MVSTVVTDARQVVEERSAFSRNSVLLGHRWMCASFDRMACHRGTNRLAPINWAATSRYRHTRFDWARTSELG